MGGVVEHCKRMVVFISVLFWEALHRLCNSKLQADGSAKARTKQDLHTQYANELASVSEQLTSSHQTLGLTGRYSVTHLAAKSATRITRTY